MKIAVNARPLLFGKQEGISVYADHMIRRLLAMRPEADFQLFFDRYKGWERYQFPNAHQQVLFPITRHRWLWTWWFDRSLSGAVRTLHPDVFYSPEGHGLKQSDVPQLVTLHDLAFEHRPQDLPKALAEHYRRRSPLLARRAAAVLTVSEDCKHDLIVRYSLSPERVHVLPPALPDAFYAAHPAEVLLAARRPYFLMLGALHPRKNPEMALKAFARYRESGGKAELVFAGQPFRFYAPEFERLLSAHRHRSSIRVLGWVGEAEKLGWLKGARALLFPSWFEGFGLPILEAFAMGTPVVASDRTSLPEVGGDAGLYADPTDVDGWAEHMLLLEQSRPEQFDYKAKNRLESYSWDRSAKNLSDLIDRYARG